MTALSVNVNKFALIRNSRGTNHPDLIQICNQILKYGANGITVHPRPDERHSKISDLKPIKDIVRNFEKAEFNIEGYPSKKFIKTVINIKPDQVTLVPDPPNTLTSSFGWDCKKNKDFLSKTVKKFQESNIRVSIFINPSLNTLKNLEYIKPNRVELYTFNYSKKFKVDKNTAISPYLKIVNFLNSHFPSIELNAGHDLNTINLQFFLSQIPTIKEVSIGHAIVCDSIQMGIEKTIKKYLELSSK
tara:strand:+ start:33 stop:767 length:735 start_codon:yes stop_codon:yes gene_type:complete